MKLPEPLKRLYDLWMRFAHILGGIMSFILLSILWFFGFGVYGIGMKIMRWTGTVPAGDCPQGGSYWVDVPLKIPDDMRHQF